MRQSTNSRFLQDLGYNPYGIGGMSLEDDGDFDEDFDDNPFPDDGPIYE